MTRPSASRDPRFWLTSYINLQIEADKSVIRALEEAARDAVRRINLIAGRRNISSVVERAQLQSARVQIFRALGEMYQRIGESVRANRLRAAALAVENTFQWEEFLLERGFPTEEDRRAMRDSLEQTASRNVEAAVARMTRSRITLSGQVYRSYSLSRGTVDRIINSALARGLNYRQLAAEVRSSIRPDAPGGISYAAKRLARTEINNAYHAISIQANKDKPWANGMVWRTSKSHPKEDICDLLEAQSPFEWGKVPRKPHPQCLCYVYPELVSEQKFLSDLNSGVYDNYLASNYGVSARTAA